MCHHAPDRQTIRRHASRPHPSPSPERLRQSSAVGRDNSVKNHPSREIFTETKHNRIVDSEKIKHRPQSIHLIPIFQKEQTDIFIDRDKPGENGANGAIESRRQKPAKRVLWKPPLPRDKSRTIIGGTDATPEAKPVRNTET
ncbi:hypothetical protein F2Q69_00007651 [Brassica cretica]|uniref:Uncharacterized protein n=1 Tax=Brassica cretica TaxID=69181 RepID=A0A8S9PCY7_BRACR|nr:hypothetical protein F2Q69_00007651 [Brassica cretica]